MKEKKEKEKLGEKIPLWVKLYAFLEQFFIFICLLFITICLFDIIFQNILGIFDKDLEKIKDVVIFYDHPFDPRLSGYTYIDLLYVYLIQGSVVMCFSLSIIYNPLVIFIMGKLTKLKNIIIRKISEKMDEIF